ncbi:PREDICTED: carotenoid isomerooxygenase-like [Papilio polytes]|uniref:carotenoid isomerooxygenase-like n=1 Tax=Papilio polytes TaxID=76194 RepID=UPI000676AA00|nr:PREDICTED: carotenoid isomerooxygenase-like [Papilio polytes]
MAESSEKLYPNCNSSVWLRSCDVEVTQPLPGRITGKMPTWLRGSLLRNGPGSLNVGSMRFEHLFDSSALVHRFSILDGAVTYQCRFVRTNTFKRNRAANRIVVTEFGTKAVPDPCHTIFDRVASIFKPAELSDNTMISLYPFGDEIYTFTEGPFIHRIDPKTLDTLERKDMMKCVAVVNHTSHPHVMPNGDVINVGMSIVKGRLRHDVVKFPYTEKGDMFERAHIIGSMKPRWTMHPAYMHTFGVTENYFVIIEQPLTVSICGVLRNQLTMQSNAEYAEWFRGRPKRLEVALAAPTMTKVTPRLLADLGCETPRINYDLCNGRPYRYFYAISSDVDAENPGAIIKVDTSTGESWSWCESDCYPSEPVFISDPGSREEHGGILLSALLWGSQECSLGLLVLDARTMKEIARVDFETPSPAPKCLHGWFLPEKCEGDLK